MKDAMQFVFETGRLLARACDSFVSTERTGKFETKKTVQQLIEESQGNKGCLLHYVCHLLHFSHATPTHPLSFSDFSLLRKAIQSMFQSLLKSTLSQSTTSLTT